MTISGAVTYRERIALMPEAAVTVVLLDVTDADAPVTVAEQSFRTSRQVPIPFTLDVERSALDPARRYAISARINVGDRPAWASDQPLTAGRSDVGEILLRRVPR